MRGEKWIHLPRRLGIREREFDGWTEIEMKTVSGGETEACQEEDDWAPADLTSERKETASLSDSWVSSHFSLVVCMCELFSWVNPHASHTVCTEQGKIAFHIFLSTSCLCQDQQWRWIWVPVTPLWENVQNILLEFSQEKWAIIPYGLLTGAISGAMSGNIQRFL